MPPARPGAVPHLLKSRSFSPRLVPVLPQSLHAFFMSPLPTILFISLALCSLTVLVYWFIAGIETLTTIWKVPTAQAGLALADAVPTPQRSTPRVCIVIPAHNEAEVIARITHSLIKQDYPNFSVVFALDRCTDDTLSRLRAAAAGDPRIEWIEIASCPADWAGKVNAVHHGATGTTAGRNAELLLFTDADTIFHPRCLTATVAMLQHQNIGMLSLLSTLTTNRWFELLLQPVAGFQMLTQFPLKRANRTGSARRALANGQFMLFTRKCYDAIGGHTRTSGHLLEDIKLARLVLEAGFEQSLLMAHGLVICEMYRSWPQFARGWKRIFTELSGRNPRRLRKYALRLAVLNGLLPLTAWASVLVWPLMGQFRADPLVIATAILGALGLICHLGAMACGLLWSGGSPLLAVLHAPGAIGVALLLRNAASDLKSGNAIQWGGKAYDLMGTNTHEGQFISREPIQPFRPPQTAPALSAARAQHPDPDPAFGTPHKG